MAPVEKSDEHRAEKFARLAIPGPPLRGARIASLAGQHLRERLGHCLLRHAPRFARVP
jgi:hypothetical protein